ncbi:MAG TPA: VWA domain-containing protein [Gemmatimonadales bacterium]|nr:VWA domain-containing protein [Gemmatimonadales bacterium]
MSIDSILLLALAPVIALVAALLAWRARRARLRAAELWAPEQQVARGGRGGPWLVGAACLIAGVGAAGPRWGSTETEMEGRALNLAIGIDISRSMLAEDVAPSRLQRAIRESSRLVQDARGDRLALIAFAGRSYILTPLTLDDGAVSLQLDALDPDIASEGGTDLASVLVQGRGLLTAAAEGGARALVIFTDGETQDSVDAAIAAARTLRSAGITLVLVGEGDTTWARIPLRDERGALKGYKTDADGRVVQTSRRDDILRAVADAASGILVPGDAADQAGAVRGVLAGLERRATRERRREDLTPRGWLFALAAIGLLGLQAWFRKGPALAVLLLMVWSGTSAAQRPSTGDRLLRRGDTTGAIVAYTKEAVGRLGKDTALFNAGSAALAQRQFGAARQLLTQATKSLDPELRFRALYNLGLTDMLEARTDTAHRAELEQSAANQFREALMLTPRSQEAKWNLELAQQPKPPPSGGGGATPPPKPQPNAPPTPSPRGNGVLSQAEAEQILNSVERNERDVRADQARRRRVAQSSSGKDW